LCEAGADPQRVHVLSPSVDLGLFHPAEASRNGLKLGFVGRLEESKGIAELPRVLQRVPEAQIEVAGGGDAAISGTVLLGELPASEVAKRMRAWRVLLLPSHTEGYPRVVAEAAASGLPVAAVTGVLPSELERQPGIHVAARPDYPELVAHLVTQAPTERRADWVHSHDDAAQAWDELLDRLPPWRVRARPSLCRRSRLRRFRPPRRVARRVLRRSVAPRGSRLSIGAAACWCLQRLTNGNSSGCNGSGASVSLD
jgi:glycosyltransferase involved in cell wall biosynthesis